MAVRVTSSLSAVSMSVIRVLGEDVEADVAAHLKSIRRVVRLGLHRRGGSGPRVGEDADDVGAAADLAVQAFLVGSAWGAVFALAADPVSNKPVIQGSCLVALLCVVCLLSLLR